MGMSLKTIITTLILASSSVALAQPMVRDHRDTDTITISGGLQASAGLSATASYAPGFVDSRYDGRHDHSRWNAGYWRRHADRFSREVMLAPAAQMSLTNDGNAWHAIDTKLRVMSLQLDGLGGTQYINYLVLHLADGTDQTVSVRRQLDARHQKLTVDLGSYGKYLRSISVYGSSPTRTSLQITGLVR